MLSDAIVKYQKKISITSYAGFTSPAFHDFDQIASGKTTFYYVSDCVNGNIIQFDDSWQYLAYRSFYKL